MVAKLASRRLRRLVKRKKELSRQYTPDEMEAVKRMIAQRDAGELSRDSSVSQLRTGDTDELSPVNGRETRHRSSCSIDKTADGFLLPPPSPAQGAHRRVRSTHVGSLTDMSLKVEPKAEVTLPGTATSESFEPGDSAPSKRSSTSITLSLFSQTASRAPFTRPRTLETTTKADAHFAMQNILHGGIIL